MQDQPVVVSERAHSLMLRLLRQLLFHVDNGAGRTTAAAHAPVGDGFCDGGWHTVVAKKLRHKLELLVDGQQSRAESPNARSNTCDTNDPIYVGGYPGTTRTPVKTAATCTFHIVTSVSAYRCFLPQLASIRRLSPPAHPSEAV